MQTRAAIDRWVTRYIAAARTEAAFDRWATRYLADARTDRYRKLGERLEMVGWATPLRSARRVLRHSIMAVALVLRFRRIDGREDAGGEVFLAKQVYDPSRAAARWLLTFRVGVLEYFEILVDRLDEVDRVDLHNALGYRHLYVTRPDNRSPERRDMRSIEAAILRDFTHDYDVLRRFQRRKPLPVERMVHLRDRCDDDEVVLGFDRCGCILLTIYSPDEPLDVEGRWTSVPGI
ncbi:MAG: hypothetical protein HY722_13130 [Planctomycetes bacterium]|nr:hypothetical protein [Planctomycetota bacterium]